CMNSLRQLGLGMMMYIQDNNDTFPGWASSANGWRPEDWIYWRTNDPAHHVEDSPIIAVLGTKRDPKLFVCPADKNTNSRPFPYSYSLNSQRSAGGANTGMSTSW